MPKIRKPTTLRDKIAKGVSYRSKYAAKQETASPIQRPDCDEEYWKQVRAAEARRANALFNYRNRLGQGDV